MCSAGLLSEQNALVDFLVLARCHAFVGFGVSTFSFLLPQYKAALQYAAAPAVLVDLQQTHNRNLFELFGRIVAV